MNLGLCPGDFQLTSALDAHRQEAQRDFGDPIGITSLALVEGLFGVQPDLLQNRITIRPGRADGIYLLLTGTTLPQCSRMEHGIVSVNYSDGSAARLSLRNPETWWPIEQDYLLDDYMFIDDAPLPPRVDLRTGQTRVLEIDTFKGKGRSVPGGAATLLHLPLDATKELAMLKVEVTLYGVVGAFLAATLHRPA